MPHADFEALVLGQAPKTQAAANDPTQTAENKTTVNNANANADDYEKAQPFTTLTAEDNNANNYEQAQPFTPLPAGAITEADRLACWVEKMDIKEIENKEMTEKKKYNRTVIISPLPDTVTIAEILPRVRGGVDSCYVSRFEENRIAVVTFKLPADAITYVEFCAESPIWGLWTFEMSRPGVPFTWKRRAEVQLFKTAPGMGADIPARSYTPVAEGSRCLVYNGCKPHEVAGIYRALGLHYSQHQRDQVEGMWLDGPIRDEKGDPVQGSLHIWFTSIRAARDAKMRWLPLQFEWDPCSDPPPSLMLHLEEIEDDKASIFKHYEPFVNLAEVNQDTIFNGVVQGIVEPAQAYWRPIAVRPGEGASLASRLQWSLQSHAGGGGGGQAINEPTMATTPYQPTSTVLPAAQFTDPFVDTRPIAAGFPPQLRDDGTTYTLPAVGQNIPIDLQPFAVNRNVHPDHFLSPTETYIARTQERQALGFPPYTNTNNNSNLDGNTCQSGRQPHPGADYS